MKMITGKTLFILVLLLLKSSELTGQEDEGDKPDADENIEKENAETQLPAGHDNWMKTLDKNKLISDITIPGIRDTMALLGGKKTKCQVWPLENQLKAGIRYLDLRVSSSKLKITRGIFNQDTSLPEVLETIKTFLKSSNKEFVLVRITPTSFNKKNVQGLVEKLIKYENNIYNSPVIPRIDAVQGKIVLVQKESFKLGISLTERDSNEKNIIQHLEEANNHCKSNIMSLITSSSSVSDKTCLFTNPTLKKHIEKQSEMNPKPCYGIIAVDFINHDLIELIIKLNA